jgi:prefoldin subunit 5
MGLGDVKGASDRDEGVIVSRSLENVDDGVRFSYTVRPALGGRIAVSDDVGEAVSATVDGDTELASMALEAGTVDFELAIDAGVREVVDLIVHDVDVAELSIAEPTVERLETDESDAERPSGVFGRLGNLLGGSSEDADQPDDQPADRDGADPLDVAALEALSDDVPETPADVIEGADDGPADSAAESGGDPPLDSAVEEAIDDTDSEEPPAATDEPVPDVHTDDAATEDAEAGASSMDGAEEASTGGDGDRAEETTDQPTVAAEDGAPAEADGAIGLDGLDDALAAGDEDRPEPSVPDADDSVLADLVAELESDDAAARRVALREALGLSARTTEEVETLRERQLAIRDAVEDLRTQTREMRQSQTTLESRTDDIDEMVEAIRDEVSTLHRGCSVLEEEVTGFSDRLAALEEGIDDVDALREDVEAAESQREQLTEGIKAVDDRVDDIGEQKARLQERLDRLESTIQELEAFRSSLARALGQPGGGGQSGGRPGGPGGR